MFFVTGLDWTELTQNIFVTQQIQPCVLSLGYAPIFETQEKKGEFSFLHICVTDVISCTSLHLGIFAARTTNHRLKIHTDNFHSQAGSFNHALGYILSYAAAIHNEYYLVSTCSAYVWYSMVLVARVSSLF